MNSLNVLLTFILFASFIHVNESRSGSLEDLFYLYDINERTLIMLKPDAVQRGLVAEIIKRFEQKGFKLIAMRMIQATEEQLEKNLKQYSDKSFYSDLLSYMKSGPLVPMVWEGLNIVEISRKMLGNYNPFDAAPGTIRGDFAVQVDRNLCHAADSVEAAKEEIALWFNDEVVQWDPVADEYVYNELIDSRNKASCKVKDKATKRRVNCEFPFKYKGQLHNGCIDFIDIKNGVKVPGKRWCSTKVTGSDREHVSGGDHYGDCNSSCPDAY